MPILSFNFWRRARADERSAYLPAVEKGLSTSEERFRVELDSVTHLKREGRREMTRSEVMVVESNLDSSNDATRAKAFLLGYYTRRKRSEGRQRNVN
jgi:hypothetical protein